jgi:hypothetical protein
MEPIDGAGFECEVAAYDDLRHAHWRDLEADDLAPSIDVIDVICTI